MSQRTIDVHKLSVTYNHNTAVRHCSHISRYTFVRNVRTIFLNSIPVCNVLDERKILLLLKSYLECDSNIIRLCAFLRLNDDNVIDVSLKYDCQGIYILIAML
jgi:hypothetical protein